MALTDKLTAIGDAIRETSGELKKYTLAEMPDAIRNLYAPDVKLVVSEPVAYTIANWDEALMGHTYTLSTPGYVYSTYGVQLGLMPHSSTVNTDIVVNAGLSVAKEWSGSIELSAVNVPKEKFTIALFGLEKTTPTIPDPGKTLEEYSWSDISKISAAGQAADYFKRGDTKSVAIKGTIGTKAFDLTLYVYILDINHDGDGRITFAGFLNQPSSVAYKDGGERHIALVDDYYGTYIQDDEALDGQLLFTWNHWIGIPDYDGTTAGGWKACDLRYDILGSTDRAPYNYGHQKTPGALGYDATSTTATSPVKNTLMAALPSDLRSVMLPMTIYTDNAGQGSSGTSEDVTASIDYLPLRSAYEYFGDSTDSVSPNYNINERDRQKPYAYERYVTYYDQDNVTSGYNNSKSSVNVWTRSTSDDWDICTNSEGPSTEFDCSLGLAPIFKV